MASKLCHGTLQAAVDSDMVQNLVDTLFEEVPGPFDTSPDVHEIRWVEDKLLRILDTVQPSCSIASMLCQLVIALVHGQRW